ncbi:hypothetical protein MUN86_28130 (plasmid) [Hymenobacter volaticus]|uniref:Uncharacterized protein n=1 Tax=Hymenobacter volaticus TaxID=2932254 RepID=A0ABY4GF82_9BACT|nr:hypothetical protein MUN86_28130 [Hymenobacter volaticus]
MPSQPKVAVIELDKKAKPLVNSSLYKIGDDGQATKVFSGKIAPWGNYYKYNYVKFDFSSVKIPGIKSYRTKLLQPIVKSCSLAGGTSYSFAPFTSQMLHRIELAQYPIPMATAGHLGSGGIDWDGKGLIVKMEGDSITDLYYAKNLSGLCLQ